MKAALLHTPKSPLQIEEVEDPRPKEDQVLLRIHTCGVCRTDLHIFLGELIPPAYPIIPGHQVVGEVIECGSQANRFRVGERIGVPWLGSTCGVCRFCKAGKENLCDHAQFTGFDLPGGFAEKMVAREAYAFPLPEKYDDLHASPLLCAGLIGFRAYKAIRHCRKIGFWGFGAAAHLLLQLAVYEGKEVYVFTKEGDETKQELARNMGAVWAGSSNDLPPKMLEGSILFAPVGLLVPRSLKALEKGGIVVSAGIYMTDIPAFPYSLLWQERTLTSVANLTRDDGEEYFALARELHIVAKTTPYPLTKVNDALYDLEGGKFSGSAVLINT